MRSSFNGNFFEFSGGKELLEEGGNIVTYEAIRQWVWKFWPDYAQQLKSRQGSIGDIWHIDEIFVPIQENWQFLNRSVNVVKCTPRNSKNGYNHKGPCQWE